MSSSSIDENQVIVMQQQQSSGDMKDEGLKSRQLRMTTRSRGHAGASKRPGDTTTTTTFTTMLPRTELIENKLSGSSTDKRMAVDLVCVMDSLKHPLEPGYSVFPHAQEDDKCVMLRFVGLEFMNYMDLRQLSTGRLIECMPVRALVTTMSSGEWRRRIRDIQIVYPSSHQKKSFINILFYRDGIQEDPRNYVDGASFGKLNKGGGSGDDDDEKGSEDNVFIEVDESRIPKDVMEQLSAEGQKLLTDIISDVYNMHSLMPMMRCKCITEDTNYIGDMSDENMGDAVRCTLVFDQPPTITLTFVEKLLKKYGSHVISDVLFHMGDPGADANATFSIVFYTTPKK